MMCRRFVSKKRDLKEKKKAAKLQAEWLSLSVQTKKSKITIYLEINTYTVSQL